MMGYYWIAELGSAIPGARKLIELLTESQFSKMARVNRIASNKPKLDTVLLHFGLVKFGWELSGLVWFGMDEFGLV